MILTRDWRQRAPCCGIHCAFSLAGGFSANLVPPSDFICLRPHPPCLAPSRRTTHHFCESSILFLPVQHPCRTCAASRRCRHRESLSTVKALCLSLSGRAVRVLTVHDHGVCRSRGVQGLARQFESSGPVLNLGPTSSPPGNQTYENQQEFFRGFRIPVVVRRMCRGR